MTPAAPHAPRRYPRPDPARAGMRGLCPDCGQGKLFARGLSYRDACDVCGADFAFGEDVGDGPAVFVIFAIGIFIVPIPVILSVALGWPTYASLGLFIPIIAGVSYWLLLKIRGVMFAKAFDARRRRRRASVQG